MSAISWTTGTLFITVSTPWVVFIVVVMAESTNGVVVVGVSAVVATVVADGSSSAVGASLVVGVVSIGGCSCRSLLAACFVLFLDLSCSSCCRFCFSACSSGRCCLCCSSCHVHPIFGWVPPVWIVRVLVPVTLVVVGCWFPNLIAPFPFLRCFVLFQWLRWDIVPSTYNDQLHRFSLLYSAHLLPQCNTHDVLGQSTFVPSYVASVYNIHVGWHMRPLRRISQLNGKRHLVLRIFVMIWLKDNRARNKTQAPLFLNYPLDCSPLSSNSRINIPIDSKFCLWMGLGLRNT